MKYDVAVVTVLKDQLMVKYVDTYPNALLKNDGSFVKISNVAADVINEALSNHNHVFLPKNVPGELAHTDVIISENDGLEKDKLMFLSDMYRGIDYQLFMFSAIDFYDFLAVFNEMTAAGYFITDQNREEKYIEIIETGDEELIALLESYLEKKDKLDTISKTSGKIHSFETRTRACKTPEELEKLRNEFYRVV